MSTLGRLRTARTAMSAAAASLALLGLAACGGSASDAPSAGPKEPAPTTEAGPSDGGGAPSDGGGTPSDGGGATENTAPRVILAAPLKGKLEQTPPGKPIEVNVETLQKTLESEMEGSGAYEGAKVTCEKQLNVGDKSTSTCDVDSQQGKEKWSVIGVWMNTKDTPGEAQPSLLFMQGDSVPKDTLQALNPGFTLTGLGFGSMFGQKPLTAEELSDSTLQALTSEHSYAPATLKYESVVCTEGMDFSSLTPVTCKASTKNGEKVAVKVMPGMFANNDAGLMVAEPRMRMHAG